MSLMICYKCLHQYSNSTCGMKKVKGLKEKQKCCPKCGCMVYM